MKKPELTAQGLKRLALFTMLADHTAWAFLPPDSGWGLLLHIIGRITMPVMCFFVAEGYYHTRNITKYALRLGIFALISYIPFIFYKTGALLPTPDTYLILNVFFTLFLGLLALWAYEHISGSVKKLLCITVLCLLSLPADWNVYGIGFILAFGVLRDNFQKQALCVSCIAGILLCTSGISSFFRWQAGVYTAQTAFYCTIMQAGIFLSLPLLYLYNGQRGRGWKWGFYIFYPAHLLVLGLICYILQ